MNTEVVSMRATSGVTDAVAATVRVSYSKVAWLGGMGGVALIAGPMTATPGAIALFVVTTAIVLLFGHSLGMHRRLIHRSYACPLWLEHCFVYCGVLVGMAGPLGMIRTHDLRDWAQRQAQCHDFFAHRRPFWGDGWWQLFCAIRLDAPPEFHPEETVANDRFYRFLERTWMWQQLPWAVLFYAIGGWGWVVWGVCARVAVGNCGHWLIGHFAHRTGPRDWHVSGAGVQGYNVPFTALITMGECWHNNHHAFPGSAKLGLYRGQSDPGWWALCALARLGLVWDMKLPADLAPRPALQQLPRATVSVQPRSL